MEPMRRWRSPLVGGVHAGGGAHSSVDEPVCRWRSLRAGGARSPVEEPARRWSRALIEEHTHRWRSPLAGAPFSGGTSVEGSAADPGSVGAVEDVGAPPALSWSRGTRPVPKEDASTTTMLAGNGGLDGPPVRRSLEGRTWKRRWQIMGREEPWRMGGACRRCGRRRLGGTLARTGHPLYSLDRDNGLWAQLVQNEGAREGPPGRFRWAIRSAYNEHTPSINILYIYTY
jgi:hypothetical protein